MRFEEEIESSGYFWLPGGQEQKVPGTLRVEDGGLITLEIVGNFSGEVVNPFDSSDDLNIGRINGHIEKFGLITLDNCQYTTKSFSFGGISKSTISVGYGVLGVAFGEDEEILLDRFRASVEGLERWLGITGLRTEFIDLPSRFTMHYSRPDPIELVESGGLSIKVRFGYSHSSLGEFREMKIGQSVYFDATAAEPTPLKAFIQVFSKLTAFLSFALDETLGIYDVSGSSNLITEELSEGSSRPANMTLVYGAINHVARRPRLDLRDKIFGFSDIADNYQQVLEAWLSMYSNLAPVMNLYTAGKAGRHQSLDVRFLSLAHALETLHRRTSDKTMMEAEEFEELVSGLLDNCPQQHRSWLEQKLHYANEVGLRQRLKDLVGAFPRQFGSGARKKRLVNLAVDTRNYLTHHDGTLVKKVANGGDLWVLCMKMEALLQLHILKTLGFSEEQIDKMCSRHRKLREKLGMNFSNTESKRSGDKAS